MAKRKTTIVAVIFAMVAFVALLVAALFVAYSNQATPGEVAVVRESPPRTDEEGEALARIVVRPGGLLDAKIRLFRRHMNRLPASLDELLVKPGSLGDGQRWEGPYVSNEEVLIDPWDRRYGYRPTTDDKYEFWSNGPDGEEATEDDIRGGNGVEGDEAS